MQSFLMLVYRYIPQEELYSLGGISEAVVAGRISHSQMGQTFQVLLRKLHALSS